MHTYRLQREQVLALPRQRVFAFFADARNLEAITPEFLHFRIATPQPIVMASGTLIDYRLRLYGIPLAWRTRIDEFEPPRYFVDTQLRGPYQLWRHCHEFVEVPEGTLMIDTVDYQIPLGLLGRAAHGLFVERTLKRIFDYRRRRVAELLPAELAAAGL